MVINGCGVTTNQNESIGEWNEEFIFKIEILFSKSKNKKWPFRIY